MSCSNCFGCTNLRGKSYYIFNKSVAKEEYQKFISEFNSGSHEAVNRMKKDVYDFWHQYPVRFALAFRVENSTGEYIQQSRNLKYCYSVYGSDGLAYCQFCDLPTTDSYDCTSWGIDSSLNYDTAKFGFGCSGLKFCLLCWPSCRDLEYSVECNSSSNLFGCVGLKKKEYCILNTQYSKDDFFSLREKIIKHMDVMPYVDAQGNVYRYGEFLPAEFSPFAYNETMAQDFFPLTKEEAGRRGYLWREPEAREFKTTLRAGDLLDHIQDFDDQILKEIIACISCGRAYRIIPMELEFYRRIPLPLPRFCPDCRFRERFRFVNPPKWRHAKCHCVGQKSDNGVYQNQAAHFHGSNRCPNEFETSYAPERPEIVDCEVCYQSEII